MQFIQLLLFLSTSVLAIPYNERINTWLFEPEKIVSRNDVIHNSPSVETWWMVRDPEDKLAGIRAIFPEFIRYL